MSVHPCPACRHLNAAAALRCAACNADLTGGAIPAPPQQALATTGAIWLDDLEAPPAQAVPAAAPAPGPVPGRPAAGVAGRASAATARTASAAPAPAAPVQATPDADAPEFSITLRDVFPAPQEERPNRTAAAPLGPFAPLDVDVELVASDPARPWTPAEAHNARRAADRNAQRAAVRRERLRAPGTQPAAAPAPSEVLVVDADPAARERLTALLRGFGFTVHPQSDPAVAAAWSHRRRQLTAAFLDLPDDPARAEATLALCKSIRGRDRLSDAALPAVLVLVAAQLRPVDRVRAELAGCDATIAKPVTRGSVAGVLDARGVALPADARRRS